VIVFCSKNGTEKLDVTILQIRMIPLGGFLSFNWPNAQKEHFSKLT
jgi:hypothetical protein